MRVQTKTGLRGTVIDTRDGGDKSLVQFDNGTTWWWFTDCLEAFHAFGMCCVCRVRTAMRGSGYCPTCRRI
jgi:hypothetical protein